MTWRRRRDAGHRVLRAEDIPDTRAACIRIPFSREEVFLLMYPKVQRSDDDIKNKGI